MDDFAGVYRITNTVNGKVYVGSSVTVKKRIRQHISSLNRKKHNNQYLQRSWDKFGETSFVFEPLLVCATGQVLFYEQLLLDGLEAANPLKGYNSAPTAGSSIGFRHSTETIAKISAAHKGKSLSEQTKMRIGKAQKGKIVSEDVKLRMSAVHTGRIVSDETRKKMSASKIGKPGHAHTEEAKAKISAANSGIVPSAESREKMRIARNAYVARMLKENGD